MSIPSSPGYELGLELSGHEKAVLSVEFSQHNELLASCSKDETVRIWDIDTGRCQQILRGHSRGINDISWSADTRCLCTASDDKTIQFYEMNSGNIVGCLTDHMSPVICVSYNPHTNMVVSGSFDGTVRLFDVRNMREIWARPGHTDPVSAIDFDRYGSLIVSSSHDGFIHFWDTPTGQQLKSIYHGTIDRDMEVSSVSFSPNGQYILAGTLDNTLRLRHHKEQKTLKTYTGHWNTYYCLSSTIIHTHSPEVYVASGSEDGSVYIWELQSKTCVQKLPPGDYGIDVVMSVACHPILQLLASGNLRKDRNVKIWKTPLDAT